MKVYIVIMEQNNETHEIVAAHKTRKHAEIALQELKNMQFMLTEGWAFEQGVEVRHDLSGLYEVVDPMSERALCIRIEEVELKN